MLLNSSNWRWQMLLLLLLRGNLVRSGPLPKCNLCCGMHSNQGSRLVEAAVRSQAATAAGACLTHVAPSLGFTLSAPADVVLIRSLFVLSTGPQPRAQALHPPHAFGKTNRLVRPRKEPCSNSQELQAASLKHLARSLRRCYEVRR